ncbi:MAG: formylglycine-generating enzyme family protein [Bacteroidales bacterium]
MEKVMPALQDKTTESKDSLHFTVNGVPFEMVYVEAGTFTMGCTAEQGKDCGRDENPSHEVTLSPYYIGKFEVTRALWEAVMGENSCDYKGKKYLPNLAKNFCSWGECQELIHKLNTLTGKTFSLPTEAQWEYAARGGSRVTASKYAGSNIIDDVACYVNNSSSGTQVVGTKSPNELGIYDMSGNLWEWCSDWYGAYTSDAKSNPTGANLGRYRVHRGGSWNNSAQSCRVSSRGSNPPSLRYLDIGLRLALVL